MNVLKTMCSFLVMLILWMYWRFLVNMDLKFVPNKYDFIFCAFCEDTCCSPDHLEISILEITALEIR